MSHNSMPTKQNVRELNKKIIRLLAVFLCFCVCFSAGFAVRGDTKLLSSLGFTSLAGVGPENPGATSQGSTYNSIAARIAEVDGLLKQESLDTYDLDKLTSNVINAFMKTPDDPALRYFDANRYQHYRTEINKEQNGIGILFGEYNGHPYALDVFPGSEAQADGVNPGDFVVAVDGNRQEWTQAELIAALAREEGQKVTVTFRRPERLEDEGGREFSVTLSAKPYTKQNLETEMHDKVGYIRLRQLTQNSDKLVKEAIDELTAKGANSLVLDLRDNPGGYLTQSVNVASLFVKSGVIAQIETQEGKSSKNATGNAVTQLPLVVLVNKHTAAAAEVLAAALQDNKRATLVGETTQGKGTVQVVKPLSFGGALRYTAARYLSPTGHFIDGVGVTPDDQVAQSGDQDAQKLVALGAAEALVRNLNA